MLFKKVVKHLEREREGEIHQTADHEILRRERTSSLERRSCCCYIIRGVCFFSFLQSIVSYFWFYERSKRDASFSSSSKVCSKFDEIFLVISSRIWRMFFCTLGCNTELVETSRMKTSIKSNNMKFFFFSLLTITFCYKRKRG